MEGPLRYVEDEDEETGQGRRRSTQTQARADDVYRGRVSKGTETDWLQHSTSRIDKENGGRRRATTEHSSQE